jgi:hypothetical protein
MYVCTAAQTISTGSTRAGRSPGDSGPRTTGECMYKNDAKRVNWTYINGPEMTLIHSTINKTIKTIKR